MRKLDVLLLITVLVSAVAAATKGINATLYSVLHIIFFALTFVVSERYSAAWWRALIHKKGQPPDGLFINLKMIVSAISSQSTLLAFYIPLQSTAYQTSTEGYKGIKKFVNTSMAGYLLGLFLLFYGFLILLFIGFDGTAGGRLFSRLLITYWGEILVYAISTFLSCWSLSFYLFSKHIFIGRQS